jgi:hypothetical protein
MLDTPRSALASSEIDDTSNLATRAALVAHSMLTDDTRNRLARELGVNAARLALVDTSYNHPVTQTTLPLAAAEAAATTPEPYLLQMDFDGETPIVSLAASAPDPRVPLGWSMRPSRRYRRAFRPGRVSTSFSRSSASHRLMCASWSLAKAA